MNFYGAILPGSPYPPPEKQGKGTAKSKSGYCNSKCEFYYFDKATNSDSGERCALGFGVVAHFYLMPGQNCPEYNSYYEYRFRE